MLGFLRKISIREMLKPYAKRLYWSLYTYSYVDAPFDRLPEIGDVIAAYRLILGRNPDQNGLADYQELIKHGMSTDRLFQSFMTSDEYHEKQEQDESVQAVDCGGYYVCVQSAETDFGRAILSHKTWEPHILETLKQLLKEGDTFVDVGANVGMMAFLGAQLVGESGTVVAIEPNQNNLQLLYAGIVKNEFRQIQVLPFAASNQVDIFSLDGGRSNTYLTDAKVGKEYVQSVVLDDTLQHLPKMDVVKIDIEGHEPFAIAGFRQLLAHHRPIVLLEFNPHCLTNVSGVEPQQFLETIFELFENVNVVEHSGEKTVFEDADSIWAYWEKQNEAAVKSNWLPDGLLHFDIVAKAK